LLDQDKLIEEAHCEYQSKTLEDQVNQEILKISKEQIQEVNTLTAESIFNYSIRANIGGAWVSFLVDT